MNAPVRARAAAVTRESLHECVRAAILEVGFFDSVLSLSQQGSRLGPMDLEAERFLIASVLCGDVLPGVLQLEPSDMWAVFHQRIWRVMLTVADPTDTAAIEAAALDSGALLGPIAAELDRMKLADGCELARGLKDIEFAAERVRVAATERRLVKVMQRITSDLCTGHCDVKGARALLSEFFRGAK